VPGDGGVIPSRGLGKTPAGNLVEGTDPCRLARQVKQFGRLKEAAFLLFDPCRLVRQVKEFDGWRGAAKPFPSPLASELLHLPDEPAGVVQQLP
jgi:hypothetical protein